MFILSAILWQILSLKETLILQLEPCSFCFSNVALKADFITCTLSHQTSNPSYFGYHYFPTKILSILIGNLFSHLQPYNIPNEHSFALKMEHDLREQGLHWWNSHERLSNLTSTPHYLVSYFDLKQLSQSRASIKTQKSGCSRKLPYDL